MPILVRKPDGPYFSPGDERAFFEWAERIPCVSRLEGVGKELRLHVRRRRISRACLRELLGLFYRYGVSMRQLAQFEAPANRSWFRNESAPWYQRVFGSSSGMRVSRRRSAVGAGVGRRTVAAHRAER